MLECTKYQRNYNIIPRVISNFSTWRNNQRWAQSRLCTPWGTSVMLPWSHECVFVARHVISSRPIKFTIFYRGITQDGPLCSPCSPCSIDTRIFLFSKHGKENVKLVASWNIVLQWMPVKTLMILVKTCIPFVLICFFSSRVVHCSSALLFTV